MKAFKYSELQTESVVYIVYISIHFNYTSSHLIYESKKKKKKKTRAHSPKCVSIGRASVRVENNCVACCIRVRLSTMVCALGPVGLTNIYLQLQSSSEVKD